MANEIRQGLNTNIFGKNKIVYFKETESTNLWAKELAAKGAVEESLVVAEKYTQGMGRRGRHWFSPARDGIYVSLILRPVISPVEAPKITLMTAVAVAETLLSLTNLKDQD